MVSSNLTIKLVSLFGGLYTTPIRARLLDLCRTSSQTISRSLCSRSFLLRIYLQVKKKKKNYNSSTLPISVFSVCFVTWNMYFTIRNCSIKPALRKTYYGWWCTPCQSMYLIWSRLRTFKCIMTMVFPEFYCSLTWWSSVGVSEHGVSWTRSMK